MNVTDTVDIVTQINEWLSNETTFASIFEASLSYSDQLEQNGGELPIFSAINEAVIIDFKSL